MIRTTSQPPTEGAQRGRPKINYEQMPARFPGGTFTRMDAILKEGETRADLVRDAVEQVMVSRERVAERKRAANEAKAQKEAEAKKAEAKAKREANKAKRAAAELAPAE